jgi:hypothetical protein
MGEKMTVQELVDKLMLFPPEMEVCLEYGLEPPSFLLGRVKVEIPWPGPGLEPEKMVILAP